MRSSEGLGRTLITSHDIWNNHPEKVFAVTRSWAHRKRTQAVLMALLQACAWLDQADNRSQACELLSQGRFVNAPVDVVEKSLTGTLQFSSGEKPDGTRLQRVPSLCRELPWRSHALWFLSQMMRWGQIEPSVKVEDIAMSVYQPEVFRAAAQALNLLPRT